MKKYVKFTWTQKPEDVLPSVLFESVETECPNCQCRWRFPVKTEYVDWEKVAQHYKQYAEKLHVEIFNIARRVKENYGHDPAAQYQHDCLMKMLNDLKRDLGREE